VPKEGIQRMKRPRKHQSGSIWLRGSSFFLRFYDEQGKRKTEFLCEKDDAHYSDTCPAVKDLAAKRIERVNRSNATPSESPTAGGFWEATYLPWARANLRPSTVEVYESIWNSQLDAELGERRIDSYTPADATRFLTGLAPKMTRSSLSHVRALMSGVFGMATALGKTPSNPIRDAKVLAKSKPSSETGAYTTEETKAALKSLESDPTAAALFALCSVQALRPSEAIALKVEDIRDGYIHVSRSFTRGKYLGETKTDGSASKVKLIEPTSSLLIRVIGKRKSGWVFPCADPKKDRPLDFNEVARKRIKPNVDPWHGLYGGRRGAATKLVDLTGQLVGAAEVLRHSGGTAVLEKHYKKATTLGDKAMDLYERELAKED
jgi:integrase